MLRPLYRRMRMRTVKPSGRNLPDSLVRVSLCDRNPEVARALGGNFHDVGGVEVLEGDLLDLECDALVSPANSFTYMDGGIDQHIDRFYEGQAQRAALARIAERFYGELPVGVATIIEMASRRFPFLIVAPTMRVPGDDLSGTINVYLAMRAALAAVLDHNLGGTRRIGSVAVPGLGTGVGGMAPEESAVQMRAAYDMIVGGGWKQIQHPVQAPFVMRAGSTTGSAGGRKTRAYEDRHPGGHP
jgi:O-acetyl-ADP-ribose deacetylase (regulator of RNase III)